MLGSRGAPLMAKFLVRRLSANFTTLTRNGSAPGIAFAAWRIAARSALNGWAETGAATSAKTRQRIGKVFSSLQLSLSSRLREDITNLVRPSDRTTHSTILEGTSSGNIVSHVASTA